MPTAKIEFSIGPLSFSGEATEEWLAEQLDKLLRHTEKIPAIVDTSSKDKGPTGSADDREGDGEIASKTLIAFLQKCDATSNQNSKFLATALWTMAKSGKNTFGTKDVTGALTTAQQLKLNNPSQCLSRVTKAGHVEKATNGEFYVTPEGRKSLKLA